VVLSQGPNVLRGERLVVDLAKGVSRVEAGRGGTGRVQGLFVPGSEPKPAAPAATPAQRPAPAPGQRAN
jgi:lipopolysaccharide export system protein LptA